MNHHDPHFGRAVGAKLFCDVTQSWSDVGGGVRTYLLHKRHHIINSTPHSHLMIVPGPKDEVIEEERSITVTIASPRVPGSPHYRLMLRNGAVRAVLERFKPELIECQDAYDLPWAAIAHRRRNPETAVVAAYMTEFSDRLCRKAALEIRHKAGRWGVWPILLRLCALFTDVSTQCSP